MYDFLQIYVDEKVVVDKTCGQTVGRMLGSSNQATGKFGWGKTTTVSINDENYTVQDPTEVKIKGNVIVIVFESDHIRTGLDQSFAIQMFVVKQKSFIYFNYFSIFLNLNNGTLVHVLD